MFFYKIFRFYLKISMNICLFPSLQFLLSKGCLCLDCFKCISTAGEYPPCDDPFHNNYTQDILESPCWAGRKQRNGVFPATTCVKLAGVYSDTGETLVVRGCAVDSGTITIDTELVRMSHCGGFYYENRYVRGCVQNCIEDGCNSAEKLRHLKVITEAFIFIALKYYLTDDL